MTGRSAGREALTHYRYRITGLDRGALRLYT